MMVQAAYIGRYQVIQQYGRGWSDRVIMLQLA